MTLLLLPQATGLWKAQAKLICFLPALLVFATRSATNSVLKDMEIISSAIHLYAAIYWSIGIVVLLGCIIVGCIITGIIWVCDELIRQKPRRQKTLTQRSFQCGQEFRP
jgi:hypothetical protein